MQTQRGSNVTLRKKFHTPGLREERGTWVTSRTTARGEGVLTEVRDPLRGFCGVDYIVLWGWGRLTQKSDRRKVQLMRRTRHGGTPCERARRDRKRVARDHTQIKSKKPLNVPGCKSVRGGGEKIKNVRRNSFVGKTCTMYVSECAGGSPCSQNFCRRGRGAVCTCEQRIGRVRTKRIKPDMKGLCLIGEKPEDWSGGEYGLHGDPYQFLLEKNLLFGKRKMGPKGGP